jgi:hypothetical protein
LHPARVLTGSRRGAVTLQLAEDLIGALDPGERLAALIPASAEPPDRRRSSATLVKSPLPSTCRSMIEKNISTRFSQEA